MDILQKAFDEAIEELAHSATSEDELDALTDAIPERFEEILEKLPRTMLSTIQEQAHAGLEERRADQAAFVERNVSRWQKGFDRFELLIEIAVEAGASFNARLRPEAAKNGDILFDVLIRLHARGCLISKEILALLKNGFADGAHARWRALHELVVTAMFLSKHGSAAAISYSDYEFVEAHKGAAQLNRYEPRINSSGFSEEKMREFKSKYDEVVAKHGTQFAKPYGWAAKFLAKRAPNFSALEEDVRLDHWRPYYKWASQNVHSSAKSIRSTLGSSEAVGDILQAGPSDAGMTDPAHSTAISLLQVTCTTLFLDPNLDDVVASKILSTLCDQVGEAFLERDS